MRTTRVLALSAAVGLAFFFRASAGVVYPSETTNDWFNVDMSTLKTEDLSKSPWAHPKDGGEAKVEASVIKLDTDIDDPLTYTASGESSDIAVVAATITATLNAAAPSVANAPQAALAVVGTAESAHWTGLVGGGSGESYHQWVQFANVSVEVGATYSVRLEFDQRSDSRKIRYLVRKQGDVAWTVLGEGDGWYANPQQSSADKIKSVSFSGSGDIAALDGEKIIKNTFAFKNLTETEGYDFTNGTLGVKADIQGYAGVKAVLKVSGTGVEKTFDAIDLGTTDPATWDLTELTQGGVYAYTIEAKVGETVVGKQTGTFTAANWPTDDIWFGADATAGTDNTKNGSWAEGKKPTIENDAYVIDEEALFNVAEAAQPKGSNHVTRVDADVKFDALVDAASLEAEDGAFGGFVAAKGTNGNPQWMALVASSGDNPWAALTGAIVPETDVPYVVRAEVDFLATNKRVRYLVSKNDGEFCPLALANGSQWIDLVGNKGTLESVEMKGSGTLAKFEATIADKAVAEVNGKKFDTMAEALAEAGTEGTNTIKLLTNATVAPTQPGSYEIAPNGKNYVSGGKVSSEQRTIVVDDPTKPPVVRPSRQVMEAVKTPGGKSYRNINSLRAFLERNNVEAYQKEDAEPEAIESALNVPQTGEGENGLELWKDYALGIQPTDSIKPVTTPAGDTASDGITLAIPAVDATKYSGDYVITYHVDNEAAQSDPKAIKVPLKTGNHNIKAVFTATPTQAN